MQFPSSNNSSVAFTENQEQTTQKSVIVGLENIAKVYVMGDVEVRELNGVSLTIEEGEYCSIMGASGSGKSTCMNIIGCLDRPTTGSYYLDGLDVAKTPEKDLARIRNIKIGFVFRTISFITSINRPR